MLGEDMTLVFQMEQRPVVVVAAQDDAAAVAAVAAVGATIGLILHMAQVHGPSAAFARTAVYLHIVYKVALHFLQIC